MKKNRIEKLIPIANLALIEQYEAVKLEYEKSSGTPKEKEKIWGKAILMHNPYKYTIKENYDGKVAGFGISVLLSGLRPALAMYSKDNGDIKTSPILEVLAKILIVDGEYNNEIKDKKLCLNHDDISARSFVDLAIKPEMDKHLCILTKYVLEAATALKQIVRTYELI